jgi:hypothetical protein
MDSKEARRILAERDRDADPTPEVEEASEYLHHFEAAIWAMQNRVCPTCGAAKGEPCNHGAVHKRRLNPRKFRPAVREISGGGPGLGKRR